MGPQGGRAARGRPGYLPGAQCQPGRGLAQRAGGDREDPRRFGAARRAGDGDPEPGQGRDQFAAGAGRGGRDRPGAVGDRAVLLPAPLAVDADGDPGDPRSEEHTSELQSLMRISYAVFCLKKKKKIYYISLLKSINKHNKTKHTEELTKKII